MAFAMSATPATTRCMSRHSRPGKSVGDEVVYELNLESPWCGALRYEIRAVPQHTGLTHPYETGLMRSL